MANSGSTNATPLSFPGFAAETVRISSLKPYDFAWSGRSHYLALHNLRLRDGDIELEGAGKSRLLNLTDTMTFIPCGATVAGWTAPSKGDNSFTALYFEEKFLVELENATLTNIKGFLAKNPDLTLTINRSDLEQTMMGAKTLEAQIADGSAKVEGDVGILKQLASTMVDFDPRFEIMPGTKASRTEVVHADPYEALPRQTIAE